MTLWLVSLLMMALGLFSSASAAATITALIRYIQGFAAFVIGISWSSTKAKWTETFRMYARAAIMVFIVSACIPWTAQVLHPYTSLISVNGHHPFAGFLVLFLPLAVLIKRTHVVFTIEIIIVTIGLLLSSARLAWGIAFVFMRTAIRRPDQQKISNILLGVFGIAVCSAIWLATLPHAQKMRFASSPLASRYLKNLNIDERREFVIQATRAVTASPIIGHGAGTFSLLSRHFASGPGEFARYAHSFPLEVLAEMGLIGSLPIICLFLIIGFHAAQSLLQQKPHPELSWAILLTLIYGSIDTNLNIHPIWILFWVIAGLLHTPSGTRSMRVPRLFLYGAMIALVGIFVSGIASMILEASGRPYDAYVVAPYRKIVALNAVNNIRMHDKISTLLFWYRNDPDIHIGMKKYNPSSVRLALTYDPHNYSYLQQYLTHAIYSGQMDVIQSFICNPNHILEATLPCDMHEDQIANDLLAHQTETLSALSHLQGNDGLSKTLYFLGLSIYETTQNTSAGINFLKKARDNAPNWGYYHVALASAQYIWEHNEDAGLQTLTRCQAHAIASIGCLYSHPNLLLTPESYGSDISRIPEIQ